MPFVLDAVPEAALDHAEILRRGGANHGDEDFALCKCPRCDRVYLLEYEVDTFYLDAMDLTRRAGLTNQGSTFRCVQCGAAFPAGVAWIGARAPAEMQVTWDMLAASPWRWVTARTRDRE